MKDHGLPPRQAEVLRYIAQKGPRIYYRLSKEMDKIPPGTLHNALVELEKKQLLCIEKKGKAPRPGETIKEYHLTVLGLATALLYLQVHENPREVIKSWGSLLPLVLGKWDFFISAGVEDLARSRLMIAAVALVRASLSPEWHFAWETPIDPDEIFRSNFYHMLEYGCIASEVRLRWIEVCARDPDIRPYLIGKMVGVFVQYDIMMHEAELMEQLLRGKNGKTIIPALDSEIAD